MMLGKPLDILEKFATINHYDKQNNNYTITVVLRSTSTNFFQLRTFPYYVTMGRRRNYQSDGADSA